MLTGGGPLCVCVCVSQRDRLKDGGRWRKMETDIKKEARSRQTQREGDREGQRQRKRQ